MGKKLRIGFASIKLDSTDGVSLETDKWEHVLREKGHEVFYLAGEFGHNQDKPNRTLIPQIASNTEYQLFLERHLFSFLQGDEKPPRIGKKTKARVKRILRHSSNEVTGILKSNIQDLGLDLLVSENANAMPMSLSLAKGIANLSGKVPIIGHHHDFYWERERFSYANMEDLLQDMFPPKDIVHAVISRYASETLAEKRKIKDSIIVPNCEDFDNPPVRDDYNTDFRQQLGFEEQDYLIVVPTRIVKRKNIEQCIEFVSDLIKKYKLPEGKTKLLISLYAGDEPDSLEYKNSLESLASEKHVDLHFISNRINSVRSSDNEGNKIYTNRDVLVNSDLGLYFPKWEGFGNAYLEMVAAKLPFVVAPYIVFNTDIAPMGFRTPRLGYEGETKEYVINGECLEKAHALLTKPEFRASIVEPDFELGKRVYGFNVLSRRLDMVVEKALDLVA